MGLIKFLIIFAAIYYGFKLISRFVFPFLIQYLFKKTRQNMQDQFDANQGQNDKEEGEITIKYAEKKKPGDHKKDNDSGEYIDFEEVD